MIEDDEYLMDFFMACYNMDDDTFSILSEPEVPSMCDDCDPIKAPRCSLCIGA